MPMDNNPADVVSGRSGALQREMNTLLVTIIAATSTYILVAWAFPGLLTADPKNLLDRFIGLSWPFFVLVSLFLFYVIGALTVENLDLAPPRRWRGIGNGLHWATEASPLVGLLTTFFSLLMALLAYGAAGPGRPETQAVFITQFAIAFGSSIAGGVMSLMAFTLHRILPGN